MSKETLSKAVTLAGGQAQLARGIRDRIPGSKIGQVTVWGWLNEAKMEVPPADVVLPIADSLEWRMTPHELRPDLYPNPTDALPPGISTVNAENSPKIENGAVCPSDPSAAPVECASGDPRHGIDRRSPEKRQRLDRREEGA